MPADFEREVTEHLSLLRGDVDQVSWRDETAVRAHGARRQMRRTATAGLAVVASVGAIGYGAVVGMPGDPVTLANPFLTASPSDADEAPASERRGSRSETEDEPPSAWPFVPDPTAPRSRLPGGADSAVPSTSGPEPYSTPPDVSPSETPAPTSSDTPTAGPTTPLLAANVLLVDPEMPKVNDSTTTWSATGTSEDEGATPASACQSGDLAGLGASSATRRDFGWGTDGTVTGANVVGEFGSTADATAAYDTYTSWLEGCTWGTAHGPTDVSLTGEGTASWWWFGHDNGDSSGEIEVVGLVRTGAFLSVVVWHQDGQDFIYDTDPMAPVLRASADRLAP